MIKQCNCSDILSPSYDRDTVRKCWIPDTECYIQNFELFYSSDESSDCFDSCPSECDTVIYKLQISQAEFPTKFYSDFLIRYNSYNPNEVRNFTSHDQVKSSILAVNVYYEDISYTVIEEVASKTLEDFVADVGGFLGLCIGVSLLSFIEIVEILYKIISFYFYSSNFSVIQVNPLRPVTPTKNPVF